MDIEVLNTEFVRIAIIDVFESLIWTDRYSECGDFEIYTSANTEILDICKQDYYLRTDESEHIMIIEEIKVETDVELGTHVTIKGRSLESILMRRIIWNQTLLTGNLQNAIKQLITDAIINPAIEDRRISNFVFEDSEDEKVTEITMEDTQYTGDVLYDAVKAQCDKYNLGFKIRLNNQNEFVFSLYAGTDRSYDQNTNPYVVFSPLFDNLINSNYLESLKMYKTVTLVAGEDEGADRKTIVVESSGPITGLARRELYTDARDISSKVDGGTLTPEQYNANLKARGEEKLAENRTTRTFEGQVEPTQLYRYGEHFFMGDLTQIENEYGMQAKVRIIEFIHSVTESDGIETYPTFKVEEDDDYIRENTDTIG